LDAKILTRYNSPEGARSYSKKFTKHWNESINDWFLDVPCGYGRLFFMARELTPRVIECDWSFYLLRLARDDQRERGLPALGYVRADALQLPFPDRAFDLVLSVRLCHHIRERHERLRYVRETLRVANRCALLTYFDYHSLKNRLREIRRTFSPKRPKWTLRGSEVEALAAEAGFGVERSAPLSRLFSGHRYVLLKRNADR
jgi:SAM-dependent methyltransferase